MFQKFLDIKKIILPVNMSFYQLGEKTLKVSMKLFAHNRKSLLDRLRKLNDLPKSSIVVLEGGKSETRHCTDHEKLFRQVRHLIIIY